MIRAVLGKAIITAILALLPFMAFAQSTPILYSWQDTLSSSNGNVIPGVTIIVLSGTVAGAQAASTATQPGTPLATIYSDPYGTTQINQTTGPLKTVAGTFQFWAAAGYYVVQAYGPGVRGQLIYGIALGPSSTIAPTKITPGTDQQCLITNVATVTWATCPSSTTGYSVLNVNVTPVTANANTTSVQTLMTYTVGAGVLNGVGKTIRVTSTGRVGVANHTTTNIDLFYEVGGQSLQIPTAPPNPILVNDDLVHPFKTVITCTTTTTGALGGMICNLDTEIGLDNGGPLEVFVASDIPVSKDMTGTIVLNTPVVAYDVASASNTCIQESMLVEKLN